MGRADEAEVKAVIGRGVPRVFCSLATGLLHLVFETSHVFFWTFFDNQFLSFGVSLVWGDVFTTTKRFKWKAVKIDIARVEVNVRRPPITDAISPFLLFPTH